MDIEAGLISKITSKSAVLFLLEEQIDASYFEKYGEVFNYVKQHFIDYGVAPEASILEDKFNFSHVETEQPIEFFVHELKQRKKQSLYKTGLAKVIPLLSNGNIDEAEKKLQRLIIDTRKLIKSSSDIDIRNGIEERFEIYKRRQECVGIDGYSTPWDYLNNKTLGYHPGDLFVTIATPKMGKTWLLVYQAHHVWKEERVPVVFVTKEMTPQAIRQRFDAIECGLSYDDLRRGMLSPYQEEAYQKKLTEIAQDDVPFIILGYSLDSDTSTVSSIIPKVEKYLTDGGVLFIDGLYLMDDDRGDEDWKRIVNIAKDLKMLALQYKIPVVATTQAQIQENKSYIPDISNIAYGKYIAQYVDVLLSQSQNVQQKIAEIMYVNILAQREGEIGSFPINFQFSPLNFSQKEVLTLDSIETNQDEELL